MRRQLAAQLLIPRPLVFVAGSRLNGTVGLTVPALALVRFDAGAFGRIVVRIDGVDNTFSP